MKYFYNDLLFIFKLLQAALHTGNGYTQIEKILKLLGLHGRNRKTFTKHEQIVGQAIESVAEKSCEAMIEKEKQLTVDDIEEIQKML